MDRIRHDIPNIIAYIQKFATKSEMVFRSNDGIVFGWFVETEKPLRVIQPTNPNDLRLTKDQKTIFRHFGYTNI